MPHSIDDLMPHPNPAAHPATASEPGIAPEGNPAKPTKAASTGTDTATVTAPAAAPAAPKKPRYDFYTLLPEKEVIIPDEELSAQVKAEAAANLASKQQATPAVLPVPGTTATSPLASVKTTSQTSAGSTATASTNAATSNTASSNTTAATAVAPNAAASHAGSSVPPNVAIAKTNPPPVVTANPPTTSTNPTATTSTAAATAEPARSGQYLLQAGAFRNDKQADDLKARIAMLGLVGRVEVVQTPGGEMHRVRLGPYATASELEQAKQKLSGGGLPAVAIRVK